MDMGLEILHSVNGDVCLRYRMREKLLFNCQKEDLCYSGSVSESVYL